MLAKSVMSGQNRKIHLVYAFPPSLSQCQHVCNLLEFVYICLVKAIILTWCEPGFNQHPKNRRNLAQGLKPGDL